MSAPRLRRCLLLACVVPLLGGGGCEDDAPVAQQRGIPGGAKSSGKADGSAPGVADAEGVAKANPRPRPVLTREDFAETARDPFQSFIGTQVIELQPDRPRAQRDVRMAEYNFEDLRLIGIVQSSEGIISRALFLASDGKSKSVRQGEYFSRAEVLLAAVNRDYVEIEVVDEALAASLNMTRGERRAIYLEND